MNVNEVVSRMILECHMNISNSNECFIKSKDSTASTKIENNEVKEEQSNCCGGGNSKKNIKDIKEKENKEKIRESLETIKSEENNNDISELKE